MKHRWLYINTIDRYIIKKYLYSFFYSLILITTILVVIDVSENIGFFLKPDVGIERVLFEYYAGYIPFYVNYSYPLINFIAVIYFTSRMATNSEIISIYNTGASHLRLLKPYIITSSLLTILSLIFTLYIVPFTNGLKYKFDTEVINPITQEEKSDIHMRLDDSTYVAFNKYNPTTKTARGITFFKMDDMRLKEKTKVSTLSWDSTKKSWKMRMVEFKKFNDKNEEKESIYEKDTILDIHPEDLEGTIYLYSSMSTNQLNRKIEKELLRGTGSLTFLLLEKYKRYIYPFSTFILMIIGFSVSSKKKRGGIGMSLGIGIILSFIYILFVQFADMFALKSRYPPMLAILIPNMVFSVIGAIIFARIIK